MLMTGKEYLQSIRDGRVIYIGKERVKDQTTHPAFAYGTGESAANTEPARLRRTS
jgi:4-hydroxyphenylacetate 3-monooxygenase